MLHQAIQEIVQQQEQKVAGMLSGYLDTLKEICGAVGRAGIYFWDHFTGAYRTG